MSKKEYSRIKLGKIEEMVKSGQFEEIREVFRHQVEKEEGMATVKGRYGSSEKEEGVATVKGRYGMQLDVQLR